ncbi:hypothetical protein [Mucilaginibacter sp. CSA2-8R]|uniref:hypothetical protein n=1 Tax=Mucilaginibacter sp. CSA2-8R TaxID=3141542 RepID=UPI00315DC6D4
MKMITLLNITLIIYILVLAADVVLITFNPVKHDVGRLALPLLMFVLVFYARNLQAKKQSWCNNLKSSVITKS